MLKDRYEKGKQKLLNDTTINNENRKLFKKFFEFQEVKLKRMNGLQQLDEHTYRTLNDYIYRFKVVNGWFKNKPLKDITKKDFEKVFNDLCDGKVTNKRGVLKDVDSYVFKIFKSKLFKLAGLSDIVEECLEFYKGHKDVKANFMEEKDINLIIEHCATPKKKLLFQLAFDIGENVSSLLLLQKRDCRRQFNEITKAYEYNIRLKQNTLKRTRQERTEPTRLSKTAEMLDFVLKDLNDDDYIFSREDNMIRTKKIRNEKGEIIEESKITKNLPFSLRSAEIFFDRVVEKLNTELIPTGEKPKLKHIRVSMACDCLKKGWTSEEINGRLGHSVNSKVLLPYINFLAIDKQKPKTREYKENIEGLNGKLEEQKNVNVILTKRIDEARERLDKYEQLLKIVLDNGKTDIERIKQRHD